MTYAMKRYTIPLGVFLFVVCLQRAIAVDAGTDRQLVLVQLVLRDGLTAPSILYPNDPNDPNTWDRDLGELTLVGEKQHYAIGKQLRKRYQNFITSNPHEITASSAFRSSSLSSALSQLASLYAPTGDWQFIDGYDWQPLPVGYVPGQQDKYLGPISNCPAIKREMDKSVNSAEGQKILEDYSVQLSYWSDHSGLPIEDWNDAAELYGILVAEKEYGKVIPDWARTYWEDMRKLRNIGYRVNFNNPAILKFVGGPLLFHISQNALRKVNDASDTLHRMFMFSGESVHLASVLGALGALDSEAPPPAATLAIELFRTSSSTNELKDYSIRIVYLNSTAPHEEEEPHLLSYPGCGEFCPLDVFVNDVSKWNDDNRINECKTV